jgi:hypothetical protein
MKKITLKFLRTRPVFTDDKPTDIISNGPGF